jgi:hypothetical protein
MLDRHELQRTCKVKQGLGNFDPFCGGVRAGVTECDHRAFRLREKLVLSCVGTVDSGQAADDPAGLLEKRVCVLCKERFPGIRDGEL